MKSEEQDDDDRKGNWRSVYLSSFVPNLIPSGFFSYLLNCYSIWPSFADEIAASVEELETTDLKKCWIHSEW